MEKIKNSYTEENLNPFLSKIIEILENKKQFFEDTPKNILENANNLRIKKNILLMKILNQNSDSILQFNFNNFQQIYIDINNFNEYEDYTNNENILMFWRSITKKVEKKEVLNFPMCVLTQYCCTTILTKETQRYNLFFLKYPEFDDNNLFLKDNLKEILFQKILIFYTLDFYGLSANQYYYENLLNFNNKIYTFKLKDLIFIVPIKTIILLSPKTKLIKNKLSVNDYINFLSKEELSLINTNIIYENFYELLLENFIEFFEKKIYNTKNLKQIMELSCESNTLVPGNVYIMSNPNLSYPVYILILYSNDTHIKYLVLFDSTINKIISMSKKIINKHSTDNKFFYPNLLFETSMFINPIGF